MYPPPSSSNSTAPDGGDADVNPYDSTTGLTRDFSSIGSQSHHPPSSRQQHNPNVVGHYLPGDPSSMGFDSGSSSSSSSLFRHRSSPAGFFDQHLPNFSTHPNGSSDGDGLLKYFEDVILSA